jgi:hypothetical protein
MKTYQYQVLRFLPDRISEEFINLGIVIYDAKERKIESKFYQKISRVSAFFPSVNSRNLASSLKYLQKEFDNISVNLKNEFSFDEYQSIDQITKEVLPKDESALYFTKPKEHLGLSIHLLMNMLYDRCVINYVHEEEREYVTDKEVWNRLYKNYFDDLKITEHLQPHKIHTQLDTWEFDKAWKNGVWNLFETVSFDLVKEDSIKDKAYKWWGKIDELQTTKEPIHIFLLSKLPSHHPELSKFIKKKLGKVSPNNMVTIELVLENDAEKFAKRIHKQIQNHEEV